MESREYLLAKKARLISRAESLDNLLDELIANPRKNAALDTGDGRIATGWRSLEEVEKMIYLNECALESVCRKLEGNHGISVTRLRRYC